MPSVLWRGRRRKGPVRVRIAVELDDLAYELSFGLPRPDPTTLFGLDPFVKEEHLWLMTAGRRVRILERTAGSATARDARRAVPPLDGIDPDWTGRLRRLLAPDPARRPQTALEVTAMLAAGSRGRSALLGKLFVRRTPEA